MTCRTARYTSRSPRAAGVARSQSSDAEQLEAGAPSSPALSPRAAGDSAAIFMSRCMYAGSGFALAMMLTAVSYDRGFWAVWFAMLCAACVAWAIHGEQISRDGGTS